VYPNPASNQINIKFRNLKDQEVVLQISTVIGKIVVEERVNKRKGELSYSISGLAKGVYFIKVTSSENSITKKIIIK